VSVGESVGAIRKHLEDSNHAPLAAQRHGRERSNAQFLANAGVDERICERIVAALGAAAA